MCICFAYLFLFAFSTPLTAVIFTRGTHFVAYSRLLRFSAATWFITLPSPGVQPVWQGHGGTLFILSCSVSLGSVHPFPLGECPRSTEETPSSSCHMSYVLSKIASAHWGQVVPWASARSTRSARFGTDHDLLEPHFPHLQNEIKLF